MTGPERDEVTTGVTAAEGAADGGDPGPTGELVEARHRSHDRERDRQRLVAAVATELDRETTLRGQWAALVRCLVAEDLVDGVRLSSVDDTGRLVTRAYAANTADHLRVIAEMVPSSRHLTTQDAGPLLVDVDERYLTTYLADPEQRELRRRLALRTAAMIPLMARGRITGYISAGRTGSSRPLDEADFALLVEVCQRAAISLDNALLLERERATRQRLELLQRATAGLSAAATAAEIADIAVAEFGRLLGTDMISVYELRGPSLDALRMGPWDGGARRDWETVPLESPAPGAVAVRHREAIWLEGRADWRREYPALEAMVVDEYGHPTTGFLPLIAGHDCVGMVAIGFRTERLVNSSDRAAARTLAELCGQALQRAGLLAAESEARREAEAFSAVGGALSVAVTPAEVAEVILRHAAGLGADEACVVLREGDQLVGLAATSAAMPGRLAVGDAHPLAHSVRSGLPVWLANRSRVVWADHGFDRDERRLPVQVAVPLVAGRATLGAIGLHFGTDAPALSPAERAAVLTVAAQCAQALERARLHQAEHEVAEVLQRSLLPRRLPEVPGLAVATTYLPAAHGTHAGGDWYDLLPVGPGRVAIAVGDVVGHGAPAAAVMGQLRSVLAGALLDGHSPAQALEKLDRFAGQVERARATTCTCVVLDCATGELSYASAGHLPILLLEPDGPRYLEEARGTVLGLRRRAPYTEARTRLRPGGTLLGFTDGLIERRDESLGAGLERLAATAGRLASLSPGRLIDALTGPGSTDRSDDVAVIAVHLLPRAARDRAHPAPAATGPGRAGAMPTDPGGPVGPGAAAVGPAASGAGMPPLRTFNVDGDLTGESAETARAELLGLLRDPGEVVIDLCCAGFLTSAALGLFTEAINTAQRHDIRLSMRVPRESVAARVITITDIGTALDIEWVGSQPDRA